LYNVVVGYNPPPLQRAYRGKARECVTRCAESVATSRIAAVDAWLTKACDGIAAEAGVPAAELDLADAEARTLLDLARIAAHTSGDRTNAPLLCYLVGRAHERGADLGALADAVRRSTS
jgi:hypothetical protein